MSIENQIQLHFPEAKKGDQITRECMDDLINVHNFNPDRAILGTSVCSDEIVVTATNFRDYVNLKHPFSLGGLGGYPFAGMTGFHAFAGHIPDEGFAIIQYGPHIGINNEGHLGSVQRIGQALETTCCGALKESVRHFREDPTGQRDHDLDYQQWKLEEELQGGQKEILKSQDPLKAATEVMFERIDTRIKQLLEKTSAAFEGTTVALIGGIIINTDFEHEDWFDLREFSIHSF
jgi:hypothetical protein